MIVRLVTFLLLLSLGAVPGLAQLADMPTTARTVVSITCDVSINAAISANGAHVTYQLAGSAASPCTYLGQTFHTVDDITIQGDCSSSSGANTILDGGNGSSSGPLTILTNGSLPSDGGGDGSTNVTIQCLAIQNYGGSKNCPGAGCIYNNNTENDYQQLTTWDGWVLRNCTLQSSGGYGAQLAGSATIQNCLITRNYHGGVTLQTRFAGSDGKPAAMIGNEISYNNLRGDSIDYDASGVKSVSRSDLGGPTQRIELRNNYVHDNYATGLWCDIQCSPFYEAKGNTVINNSGFGIHFEITGIGDISDISHNVINNNGGGLNQDGSINIAGAVNGFGIFISSSSNVNVHDNNILVRSMNGNGLVFEADCRSDAPMNEENVQFYNNTVTFRTNGTSGGQQISGFVDATALGSNCSAEQPHPTSYATLALHNNTYYSVGSGDAHFTWPTIGYSGVALAAIQARPYKSETRSEIATGSGDVSGCTHVGCTGSGW